MTTLTKNEVATFVKNALKSKDVPKMMKAETVYEKWANPVNIVGNYLDNLPIEILDIINEKIPFDIRTACKGLSLANLNELYHTIFSVARISGFNSYRSDKRSVAVRKEMYIKLMEQNYKKSLKTSIIKMISEWKNLDENWTNDFKVGDDVLYKSDKCQIVGIHKKSVSIIPYMYDSVYTPYTKFSTNEYTCKSTYNTDLYNRGTVIKLRIDLTKKGEYKRGEDTKFMDKLFIEKWYAYNFKMVNGTMSRKYGW